MKLATLAALLDSATSIPRLRYRSRAYEVGGVVLLLGGVVGLWLMAHGTTDRSWLENWASTMFFGGIPTIVGSAYLFRASLRLDSRGVSIVNPLNSAFIPWRDIEAADATGYALRIYTAAWSIGVFAIEPSNWEGFRNGTTRAQRIGDAIVRLSSTAQPSDAVPTKRWLPGLLFISVSVPLIAGVSAILCSLARH